MSLCGHTLTAEFPDGTVEDLNCTMPLDHPEAHSCRVWWHNDDPERAEQPAGPSPAVLPEDGCAECTEGGTKNCTAGCRPSPTVEAPRPSGLCCRAGWEAFPEPCPWHRPSDERIVDSLIGGNPDPAVDALVDKMIGPGE